MDVDATVEQLTMEISTSVNQEADHLKLELGGFEIRGKECVYFTSHAFLLAALRIL